MIAKKPKTKRPKDTPEKQHSRFVEAAKEAGLPDDPKAFDKAFRKIVKPKQTARS